MRKGKLVVIEGVDGTGKKTQFDLLKQRLVQSRRRVAEADFPRYSHRSSQGVRDYLAGEFGEAKNTDPFAASLAYAWDRYHAVHSQKERPNLGDLLETADILISNRYTQSNIGHQASKINNSQKRQEFIQWLLEFEYGHLKIPKPDLVLLLNMPPEVSWNLKQKQLIAEGRQADLHENDREGLRHAHWAYLEAAKMFPDEWRIINVVDKETGRLLSIEEVHELIWKEVDKLMGGEK